MKMPDYRTHITKEQRSFIRGHITAGTALWKIAESLGVKISVLEDEIIRGNNGIFSVENYDPKTGQRNYDKERGICSE